MAECGPRPHKPSHEEGRRGHFKVETIVAGCRSRAAGDCRLQHSAAAARSSGLSNVPGEPDIRTNSVSGIAGSDSFAAEARSAAAVEQAWLASQGQIGELPPVHLLAISGGGDNGADGAGFSTAGPPPGPGPARVVTGISTGALIAPFAFIGPKYDHVIKTVYTSTAQKDIFKKRKITAALFGDSMADTRPLAKVIRSYVTPDFSTRSRRNMPVRVLLVGTTNLDLFGTSHLEHDRDRRQPGSGRNCAVPAHLAGIGLHSRRFPARHDRCRPRRD